MKSFLRGVLVAGFIVALSGQGSPSGILLRGYVVDATCGVAMAATPAAVARAARHTRVCALDEHCAAAGYGIVAAGKWVHFDARGDTLAKAVISASKRERGHYCEVRGTMKGDWLAVGSLREATPGR